MKRGLLSLAIISSTAPLLGLLAAVYSMKNIFFSMDTSRSTALGAIAGFLSYSMTFIVIGLLVAIPAYWFHQHFSAQVEIFAAEMEQATAQLVNQLIRHLQRTPEPFQTLPLLPVLIEAPAVVPAPEVRILLSRIWRNGFAELVWPEINSQLDAALVLHRTSTVMFLYAALISLAYLSHQNAWTAIVLLLFFVGAGIGLRLGWFPAAGSVLAYSVAACASAVVTFAWTFITVILTALPLFLMAWWRARRAQEVRQSRWSKVAGAVLVPFALMTGIFDGALALQFVTNDSSMEPAVHAGEALISVATMLTGPLHRGDLIYLRANEGEGVSRIAGLPGDRVQVVSGHLIRNGQAVEELYVKMTYTCRYCDFPIPDDQLPEQFKWRESMFREEAVMSHPAFTVPEGTCFVLNDNRNEVMDSRILGPQLWRVLIYRPVLGIMFKDGLWRWPRRIR